MGRDQHPPDAVPLLAEAGAEAIVPRSARVGWNGVFLVQGGKSRYVTAEMLADCLFTDGWRSPADMDWAADILQRLREYR